jgi:hypothetical protein
MRVEFDRGRLAERLGAREEAIVRYRNVAQMWRRADSVLQPLVRDADGALRRLRAP